MAKKMDRRKFISRAGGAAIALGGLGMFGPACDRSPATGPKKTSGQPAVKREPKVVVARDPAVWRGGTLDAERVKNLIFSAVRALTGQKSDETAWRVFFNPEDTVGIKINCMAGRGLSNNPETIDAMIAGLRAAGVPDGNIIVWENMRMLLMRAGFRPRTSPGGVRWLATDSPGIGYDDDITMAGEVGSRLSRIVSSLCTALLNAPVLKDHGIAGVTAGMKNYFGAIHNPNKLHDNHCDPYAADLNTIPALRDKTRLIICDTLVAQYHGGPGYKPEYAWKFNGFLVSSDPVALDAVGAGIIEAKRKEMGMPTLAKEGRPFRYIQTAAKRGLGTADLKKIKVIHLLTSA